MTFIAFFCILVMLINATERVYMKKSFSMRNVLALALLLCPFAFVQAKTIIWDLSGVIFKVDKVGLSYYELGWKEFGKYMLWDHKNPMSIKNMIFNDLLYRLKQAYPVGEVPAYMPEGNLMPPIMADWLRGKISGEEIIKQLLALTKDLHERHYFASEREHAMIEKTIQVIFDPQIFSAYFKPHKSALALVVECSDYGHDNAILSNLDTDSYECLKRTRHGSKAFRLFNQNRIFISGYHGFIKPDIQAFKRAIELYGLNPAECFFVDDQIENIQAAASLGIQGYWLKNNDYKGLRRALVEAGYLPAE